MEPKPLPTLQQMRSWRSYAQALSTRVDASTSVAEAPMALRFGTAL